MSDETDVLRSGMQFSRIFAGISAATNGKNLWETGLLSNPGSQPAGLPPEASEVMRLLERGNSKSAVEAAKLLHKRVSTAESEALLVQAYSARAQSMREHNLRAEADALIAMVREKYPRSAALLTTGAAATPDSIDELVRPLADPGCPRETRAAVESKLRSTLVNPADLANCSMLPPDHPLRTSAAALVRAFDAVTSAPVADEIIALPEISHRGPLGPWKPLLRAIACFYRGDDQGCERNLATIDAGSAAARLVTPLRAMLSGETATNLNAAARELVSRASGNLRALRDALEGLEDQLREGSKNGQLEAIRKAISLAQKECPELLGDLRRQISARAHMAGLATSNVNAAMGGTMPADAQTALFAARLAENLEDGEVDACFAWETFRNVAIHEGWFPPRGLEVATVYLHMAELAAEIPPDEVDAAYSRAYQSFRQEFPEAMGIPGEGIPFLHADWLYETACEMDPHADGFQQWIAWAENGPGRRTAENAAQTWHKALPQDPRPLLRLMNYAEDRGALKKALDYLTRAEKLDGLNPEVRNARLRLSVREAIRHVKGRRLRAAYKSIALLRSLPDVREKDRAAFIDAIEHVTAMLDRNEPAMAVTARRIDEGLCSQRAGAFARVAAANVCGLSLGITWSEMRRGSGGWIESISRVIMMGRDLGFTISPAPDWRQEIAAALASEDASPAALEEIGRMAIRLRWYDVAFAASAVGLTKHPGAEARFLLLRAQVLPNGNYDRCEECILAALELARRQHDLVIANEAVEHLKALSFGGILAPHELHLGEKRLKKVLDRERNQRKLPQAGRSFVDFADFDFDRAPAPRRRRRSRRTAGREDIDLPF